MDTAEVTMPAAIPRHPAWTTASRPSAGEARAIGTQSATRTASATPWTRVARASVEGSAAGGWSKPAPDSLRPTIRTVLPCTCCPEANRSIPRARHALRRFSTTRSGGSPPENERFRLPNGPQLTPPVRSVNAARKPASSRPVDTSAVTPWPRVLRSSIPDDATGTARRRRSAIGGAMGTGRSSRQAGEGRLRALPPPRSGLSRGRSALQEVGDVEVLVGVEHDCCRRRLEQLVLPFLLQQGRHGLTLGRRLGLQHAGEAAVPPIAQLVESRRDDRDPDLVAERV